MNQEAAEKLRAAFPESAIGKLPRAGTTLDYVGHAAVTDRLLEVDPEWRWEPVAFAEDGAPLIRNDGKLATLWIRLTVCGTTRYGVGSVAVSAFEQEKQLIGDAIRNAAMRFGVALDLWSKQDLDDTPGPSRAARRADPETGEIAAGTFVDIATALDAETISAMRPRDLNDALNARMLEVGGTLDQMRTRLYEWSREHAAQESAGGAEGEPVSLGEVGDGDAPDAEINQRSEDATNPASNGSGSTASPNAEGGESPQRNGSPPDASPPDAPEGVNPSTDPCVRCGSTRASRMVVQGEVVCEIVPACRGRQEAAKASSAA